MRTLVDESVDSRSESPLGETVGPDADETAMLPARLGRYLVLEKIGEGGMGIVHAAFDTTLERKVAIKLLRSTQLRRRLQREARALARLSYPNVVQIYEIAEQDGLAYIVMEFVDGSTLATWLAARPRSHAEILAVFHAAGRGLAAAHDVGLVHRDFKPGNVMVARDGRVVVMDFGLARGREPELPLGVDAPAAEQDGLSTVLTGAGMLTGTPAYMAPEQWSERDAGAHSDQFSFCVALWEALHGHRPFEGENLAALASAVLDGRISPPPPGTEVPPWLRRVLERGLAREPEQRWPSMQALLEALSHNQTRQRRVRARLAGASAIAVALALGLASWRNAEREHERAAAAEHAARQACRVAAQAIDADWNDEVRARLERVFIASKLPDVEQTWARTRGWMHEYATRWAALRTDACLAELELRTSPVQTEATLACLDERRVAFAALLDVWTEADAQMVWRAPLAASALPPLSSCSTANRPATVGDELPELRSGLERLAALRLAGKYDRAAQLVDELIPRAEAIGAHGLLAELHLNLGLLRADLGDYQGSREQLRRSLLDAIGCGEDLIALQAASALTHVVGRNLEQHQEALDWAELGDRLLARTELEGSLDHASLLVARGLIYDAMGRYPEALATLEQARSLRSAALGPEHPSVASIIHDIGNGQRKLGDHDAALASLRLALQLREAALGEIHPEVGSSLHGIGNVLYAKGDYRGALEAFRRVVAIREATLGPEHPEVAAVLSNVGSTEADLGDDQGALITLARALTIYERSLGPEHPSLAYALHNIGISHMRLGRLDESLAAHRRALELREAALGPAHPLLAASLNSVGVVQVELGRLDEALASHRRALAIRQAALSEDNPELAYSLANIGVVHEARGEHQLALEAFERARSLWARTLGPEHPVLAQVLHSIAQQQLALDDRAGARESFESALRIREAVPGSPGPLADTRFALAQLLWSAGDRERALALADAAVESYRAVGQAGAERMAAVESWRARHG